MSRPTDPELSQLLAEVANAPAAERMEYRDCVAAFGADAILALQPWLTDRKLSGFAIRAVGRAAPSDQHLAVKALREALRKTDSPTIQGDLRDELRRLGVATSARNPSTRGAGLAGIRPRDVDQELALSGLVRGNEYKRADLHASGLGGNVQKGISYPAGGDHVLLFSNPTRISETGYHDRWAAGETFMYYGEWDGQGDMQMTGGNQRVIERSPELHVFVASEAGYRYEGRFECEGHGSERTLRNGVPASAIVFQLRRAK